jgi:excisionase family DNA binding protein
MGRRAKLVFSLNPNLGREPSPRRVILVATAVEPFLITVGHAARLLGVHPLSLRKAIERGVLPAVHPLGTRCVRVRLADVRRLAEAMTAAHGPQSERQQ